MFLKDTVNEPSNMKQYYKLLVVYYVHLFFLVFCVVVKK